MQLIVASDHDAPMLATAPVMPSAEIIMLLRGWVIVTVFITTDVDVVVESKTTLQLRAYNVADDTLSVELMIEMPPLAVNVESSNDALQPPDAPRMVVMVIRTDAVD